MFKIDLGPVIDAHPKRIILQLPEGLKTSAAGLTRQLQDAGIEALLLADPCYGACDLPEYEAEAFGADTIVHLGHSLLPLKTKTKTIFIHVKDDSDPLPLVKKALPKIKKSVALVSTPQHIHTLPKIKKFLESNSKSPIIPKHGPRSTLDGQILGCDFPKTGCDQYLYIGSGTFHPLGLAVSTNKPVLIIDPLLKEIKDTDPLKKKWLQRRAAALDKARNASTFGILVSTKPGQTRLKLAERLKSKLESNKKEAFLIIADELSPQNLLGIKVDCMISTACPRLMDDSSNYHAPVLSPPELEILLGNLAWENYTFDTFL